MIAPTAKMHDALRAKLERIHADLIASPAHARTCCENLLRPVSDRPPHGEIDFPSREPGGNEGFGHDLGPFLGV